MDDLRFDSLTRAFARNSTRRGALRLMGGAVAGVLGGWRVGEAGAARSDRCASTPECGSCLLCEPGLNGRPGKCIPDPASEGSTCGGDCGICRNGRCLHEDDLCAGCDRCDARSLTCGSSCRADQLCCDGRCRRPGDDCCADDSHCSAGACCNAGGACEPCESGCEIAGTPYSAGVPNPDHDCLFCDPARSTADWSPVVDQTPCGGVAGRVCCNGECCSPTECCDGVQCSVDACPDQCEIQGQPYEADEINPANACQVCKPDRNRFDWSLVDVQTPCGGVPGRVCCNGECCSPTECCNPVGFCEECGPHCRIGGVHIDAGEVRSDNACLFCDPDVTPIDWSPIADNTVCGGDLDGELVCCRGACCGPNQCCTDGTCGECRCEIGGGAYDRDEVNPGNKCEVCNPDLDRDGWTPQPRNSPCGLTNDRYCCDGECCPAGECCNATGECEPCGCLIAGQDVVDGGVNPANTCQVCDADGDRENWTVLDDDEPCGGGGDDRVCCGGACCEQGQCCDGGTCQDCGCEIEDVTYDLGIPNQENACQVCDPRRDRLAWSPVAEDTPCGSGGEQICCDGICCADDECCLLGACGECLCQIGGDNIAAGMPNGANVCEVCDPDRDPFAWSPAPDDPPCGADNNQACCNGVCCAPGDCCALDLVCEECACTIDGKGYGQHTLNPDNECELCDRDRDPFAWSPDSGVSCGENRDQHCCGGVCCPHGECCALDAVCEVCACTIDGHGYGEHTLNPANSCESCDSTHDPFAWSPDSDVSCGANSEQVCCNGVCCGPAECCNPDGHCEACEPGCTIDGVVYAAGTPNPIDPCQVCNPVVSASAWWSVPSDSPCGESLDRVCCNGICCSQSNMCCSPFGNHGCDIETCGATSPCADPDLDPCGCTIAGVFYPVGTANPANDCQYCLVGGGVSATSWTNRSANLLCGPTGLGHCCDGVCCAPSACCNAAGICEVGGPTICGTCEIDGVAYRTNEVNPGNECQVCVPELSTTSWTPVCSDDCCAPLVCSHDGPGPSHCGVRD